MRVSVAIWVAALTSVRGVAAAQTTVPEPAAPPAVVPAGPGEKSWTERMTVDCLVDVFYAYQLGGAGVQRLVPAYHVFSDEGNSVTMAYAKVGIGVKPEPVGLRMDIGYGHVADVIASDKGEGADSDAAVIRFVEQAYVTFAVPGRVPFTIDVGKFVSTAGAEAIEANRNWNYSHTFLFGYATPYTVTGLRLSAAPTARLTLQAFLVNGWDVVFDNNAAKTLGVGVGYLGPRGTIISFSGLAGIELVGPNAPWRLLGDLVVTQYVGRWAFVLETNYVHQGGGYWTGAAGYVRFVPNPVVSVNLRGEVFADQAGLLVASAHVRVEDVTLTVGFPIAGHAELRAEVRADFADRPFYLVDTTLETTQVSLLAAAVAWF
jgi:hypothetical protein